MGKTTIDGLEARASRAKKPTASKTVKRSAGATMDIKAPRKKTGSRLKAPKAEVAKPAKLSSPKRVKQTKVKPKKSPKVDDFVQPVENFRDLGDIHDVDESLGADSGDNWGDLLAQMEGEADATEGSEADFELEEETGKKSKKNRKNAKKGKKKKKHRVLKVFLLLLLIGVVVFLIWGNDIIARLTNGNSGLWDTLWAMVSEEVPFETDANGRTNVLVFGTEGYDMNGSTGAGSTHDGAQLTDSIMIVSFDQNTKDVALISLPRDLKVRSACFAGKVNEVFWCNNPDNADEAAGAQAMMEEIGSIFGIDFQYWAHVNWASLIEIIDSLGGITVTLDEDIADYYFTGAVAQAGVPLQVNGEQALGLARARHGTQGGDFTRGNTQQKIIEGIIQKVISDGVDFTEIFNIVNILGDNFRSNFSADNIKAGVSLLSGFDINNIRQIPLVDYETETYYVTTAMINEISYVIPSAGEGNYSEIKSYVARMLSSDPTMREGATIAVYNATGEAGVAGAEQIRLEESGFTVPAIGDAAPTDCSAAFCVYDVSGTKSATRRLLEQRYDTQVQPAEAIPADIWPGEVDFVVIVGTAPQSAAD